MRRITGIITPLVAAVVAAITMTACGGDDGDDAVALEDVDREEVERDDEDDDEEASTTTTEDATATTRSEGDGELPQFLSDFDRVCSTQVGFDGATAYDADAAGPHPMVLFEAFGADGGLLETSRTMPAGWLVEEDSDFEDNAELAAAELVACGVRVEETPNGTSCEFDDDGETVTLELVDTVVELTVYEATTGAEVGSTTLEASTTECPFFVSYDPNDLRYFNEPTDEQYVSALQPFVEP